MLDENEFKLDSTGRPRGDDGWPVIELNQAYHDRMADHVRSIIGQYPAWYADSPEERAEALSQVVERLREEQRENPLPEVPLDYLSREHLYD